MSLKKWISRTEVIVILSFSFFPLLFDFPYRINIFLSWEGAYRLSSGQVPFRDFGMPIGGAYWVIPAIFFKIFGPQMISLIKAQAFINIISGISFRQILKEFKFDPYVRFVSLIVFLLSYSFINFWPWYNHSVIVFQLAALAIVIGVVGSDQLKYGNSKVIAASFLSVFSLFTKQDAGALTILFSFVLLFYYSIVSKQWKFLLLYIVTSFLFVYLYVFLTDAASFKYWFNYGQQPHHSRLSIFEILEDFFSGSSFIKFYFLLIGIFIISDVRHRRQMWNDRGYFVPLIFTICILTEAVVFNYTSYIPPDNNIFYHSFAFAFIFNHLFNRMFREGFGDIHFFIILALTVIWCSSSYWKYFERFFPEEVQSGIQLSGGENIVNRDNYRIDAKSVEQRLDVWKESELYTLSHIKIPTETAEGIDRLLHRYRGMHSDTLRVLNMSELTSLALEIPFTLETGQHYPLWFHLGVGMFNKQLDFFKQRIHDNYYHVVIFENIPSLNNFYPFGIKNQLDAHYRLVDSFPAPRSGDTQGDINVYEVR